MTKEICLKGGISLKKATCLCGKVSIIVKDFHSEISACHCSMCRKWGSGPFLSVSAGSGEDITITSEESVTRYKSSDWAERGFCRNCGSNLFYYLIPTDSYDIPIDLFTDESESCLKLEIYYDQKPHYYDFANDTDKKTEDEIMLGIQEKFFD